VLIFEEQHESTSTNYISNVVLGHHAGDEHRPHAEKVAHGELYLELRLIDVAKLIFDLDAVTDAVPLHQPVKIVIGFSPSVAVNLYHLALPNPKAYAGITCIHQKLRLLAQRTRKNWVRKFRNQR
jgi:hypothetical protein